MNDSGNDMAAGAPRQNSVLTESWIFAGRLFVQWRRYPTVPLQSLLFPTVLLITYSLLVGKSMVRLTGSSGLDVLIPVCAVAGALSGSLGAGMTMPYDRESGLLTRLWITPVHRASALTGILLAEALRTFAGTALILATGYALGFRFHGNVVALLAYLIIPSLVVVVFATIVVSLALRPEGRTILAWAGTGSMGLAFAALIPLDKIPAMLRPVAQAQPVAPSIEAMRALSNGAGGIWIPLALTVGWIVVIGAAFGPLAVRSYRQAAETGKVGE
ncbi:ABC transporter permease [Mycolicibacterium sp. J2]|uniref:ABC transporter permease n=1 Tax=Mycolicibacterium sp. J2 TaxID=2993511 RepID=UPI00224AFF97|nr:ABC transporter permease [Mycolicibacterium sp. J2]MCX2713503.1 ABC transporter permease [Mycolicibacterium sp. J2]